MSDPARRAFEAGPALPGHAVLHAALELVGAGEPTAALVLLDPFGRVAVWSRGAERLIGRSPEQALGQRGDGALGDASLPRLAQEAHQRGSAAAEHECRRTDGAAFRARLRVHRLADPSGARAWLAVLLEPIPGAADEAGSRQVQKLEAVGRMAGGIAHDFNNLLTAIQGHAQLLLEDAAPGAPAREDLEEILAAADRATALTRQLLTFTRRQQVDPREIEIAAVVQNLQQLLRRLIPEHITIAFEPTPTSRVRMDVGHLEQIILNLALNGRDAMPAGGTLSLRTADVLLEQEYVARSGRVPPGRYVAIAVADSGVGMDRETQARIFDPFFTTKPEGQGTGLGLATVSDLVRQYDGHVNVYSEPGRGSTFKVFLPAAVEDIAATERAVEDPGGSESVLVVEDDAVLRELAARSLRNRGYDVIDAARGDAALVMAEERGGVDIVVTDVVVPGMSGRKLADRVRQRYPRTRVLYTSGFAQQDAVRQGLADRGADYLEKPFSPERLARCVREALDRLE